MELDAIDIQIIIAIIGICAQLWIARSNRKQLQNQASKTIEVQHLVANRNTASFIADKRQKWIDELRSDISPHLALTQEIAWKWDAVRAEIFGLKEIVRTSRSDTHTAEALKNIDDIRKTFSKEHGARDREHQEKHFKLLLRLNPQETDHAVLIKHLKDIRNKLYDIQNINSFDKAIDAIREIQQLIDGSMLAIEKILKKEWTRIKQEVAFPEKLIDEVKKTMH
ncbi:hypothetical protein [Chromobacterium violaceum]|uniref:hypothetical protein n=1 Tax=Chromobacterium violaceum TaxID=536 RepID=UPI00143CE547|nr:hypothetical protein [Chromobacterium violaceum]QIY81491.1 hypothetical protein FOB43_20985 [Chromobacterium violaceum]